MTNLLRAKSAPSIRHLAIAAGLLTCVGAVGIAMAQATPAAAASAQGCSAQQIAANKALPHLFDMKNDPELAYQKMAPDYIQHNPIARRIGEVNGVHGLDEFKLLLEMKAKGAEGPPPPLPGQPAEDPYHYIMADCDHVFQLKKSYLPDPQHPGQFYEAFAFDFWRVDNGKLVEHWDGARIPPNPPKAMTVPFKDLVTKGAAEQPRPASPPPAGSR
ncbi:hypothetical protein [Sphingobium sp. HWE2-09]|uniref:hypothetical protein n=1 Tax=Sphingobium sp. HWE2-09 TaxID=3108390 RepID=UPI002DC4E8F9|nr:hypothetical protein [Sphingobium sp. HWE2-09]